MVCVLVVRIKDEEKVLKKDFLIDDAFVADQDDPLIKNCVEEVLKEFNSSSGDISISVTIKIEYV